MLELTHDAGALCELAELAIRHAKAKGADAAEARAGESVGAEVRVRLGNLDGMESTRDFSLEITAYAGGREGAASMGELNTRAAKEAAERAVAIARVSAADPCAGLAEADLMADPKNAPDLQSWSPWEVSREEMIEMAKAAEAASFGAGAEISREKGEGAGFPPHAGAGRMRTPTDFARRGRGRLIPSGARRWWSAAMKWSGTTGARQTGTRRNCRRRRRLGGLRESGRRDGWGRERLRRNGRGCCLRRWFRIL